MEAGKIIELVLLLAGAVGLALVFRYAMKKVAQHDRSKLASSPAKEGQPAHLRHALAAAGSVWAYLRYEITYRGSEDNFGLRCRVEGRAANEPVFARDLGIFGAIANPSPMEYGEEVRSQYDVGFRTGGIGYRRSARVVLGVFADQPAGSELDLLATITPNSHTRIISLELYLVPANRKL